MSFLDCNGALIPYSYEPWKDDNRGESSKRDRNLLYRLHKEIICKHFSILCGIGTPTKSGSNRMSPTLSADSFSDRQFIAIISEKYARVIALPSQNCVYRQQIADSDYAVKAEIISLKGSTFTALNLKISM